MERKNITKIVPIIMLIIAIIIISNIPKLLIKRQTEVLPEVKLKEIEKSKSFAIMVPNEKGDGYTSYSGNEWPKDEDDYYYVKSECIDNNGNIVNDAIKYNEEDNTATLTSNSTIYCTLYFDKYNYMKVITHDIECGDNCKIPAPDYMSSKIKKVEFTDKLSNLESLTQDETYWDISDTDKSPAGSVIAWIVPIDDDYDTLYIGSKTKIRAISLEQAFFPNTYSNNDYISNLQAINFNNKLDTSKTINMYRTFANCKKLEKLNGIENWNVSHVTSMRTLFQNCKALNNFDFLENWDVSNVTDIGFMFESDNLTNLNILKKWQLKSIKYMDCLFRNCTNLTDISVISEWDVSKVINIRDLFHGTSIEDDDLNAIKNWNVGNAENMQAMFMGCTNLTDVSLLNNWDVSNVENMRGMFINCTNLQIVNLSNWQTNKLKNVHDMFNGCRGLQTIDMRNATFTQITENVNYLNMFLNVSSAATIIVKQGQKDWITKAGFSGEVTEV